MFDWFKRIIGGRRPDDYVSSIDQLVDERARAIASEAGLDIDAILPLCSQVNLEINLNNRHLSKPVADDDKDGVFFRYKVLLASAAVLSYELSRVVSVSFPKPSSPQGTMVGQPLLTVLKRQSWQATRVGSAQQYEVMGRIFEDNLRSLEQSIAIGRIDIDIDATYLRLYGN